VIQPGTYKGAIHIHSDFSDGDSSMEEIIEAAQNAGLDFIIVTDHNELTPKQFAYQRRYGKLLVICGYELTFRRFAKNHLLVFGVPSHKPYTGKPYFERMKDIARDGGRLFIAHPWSLFKPWLLQHHLAWSKFPSAHFDGLEIWSYMHDWVGALKPTKLFRQWRKPDDWLRGPSPRLLQRWDRLNMKRRVAGIGALDNHARKVPFSKKVVFPHEQLFRALLTHVTVTPEGQDSGEGPHGPDRDAQRSARAIIDAIASARSYFANNAVADAEGFEFFAQDGEKKALMGERMKFSPGMGLHAAGPVAAEYTVIRSGAPVASFQSDRFDFSPPGPGVYRIEGRIAGRPWLFSNHIRIVR